jgi:type VI protein secretion system component Hcp
MSERHFMMPGKRQVRGPHRRDHHGGWLEIIGFSWGDSHGGSGGAGKATFRELEFWLRSSAASLQLQIHCNAGEVFDLVVLDVWDDSAQRSKGKLDLYGVMIAAYNIGSDREGPINAFTLNFEGMQMSPGAAPQSAGIRPAAVRTVLAKAARRPASAARG